MYAAGLKVFQKLEEGGGTNVPECKNTSVGNSVRFVTVGGGGNAAQVCGCLRSPVSQNRETLSRWRVKDASSFRSSPEVLALLKNKSSN